MGFLGSETYIVSKPLVFSFIIKAKCQRRSRYSSLTSDPIPKPGQPKSTQATCILSRSPSTSAPLFYPRWVCIASWCKQTPDRTERAMQWEHLCCSATLGLKVGLCTNAPSCYCLQTLILSCYGSHSTALPMLFR